MSAARQWNVIARVKSDFPEKFGIPRQSGLVPELKATVIFEEGYRVAEAVRGLEEFSHIWLIWEFSKAVREDWTPTVRPPRLGGNQRLGVFATRSPFRPNPIGLSCVRLEGVEHHPQLGPVLHIAGGDLMDGSPIYDIKPYLPYSDSHPAAAAGFTGTTEKKTLRVDFPEELLAMIPEEKRAGLLGVLEQDPRPAYKADGERTYGMGFGRFQIRFSVEGDILTVVGVEASQDAE